MPVYPGTQTPQFYEKCSIESDGFRESGLNMLTHTGTHIDIPAHIYKEGKTIDQFECEKFFGHAKIIDCRKMNKIGPDLINAHYDPSEKIDFLLFLTGWSNYWGNQMYFSDFPVLTPEAVELICKLSLKGVGIDAISFDETGSDILPNHKILLNKEIILIENLNNLDLLLNKIFLLSCFPLKVKGADGSPVRACAIVEN